VKPQHYDDSAPHCSTTQIHNVFLQRDIVVAAAVVATVECDERAGETDTLRMEIPSGITVILRLL
jgi:hypothetical protein